MVLVGPADDEAGGILTWSVIVGVISCFTGSASECQVLKPCKGHCVLWFYLPCTRY